VAVNLLERFGDKKQLRITGLPTGSTPNRSMVERSPQPAAAARTAITGGQQQQQRSLAPYTSVYRNNNNNNTSLNSTGFCDSEICFSGEEILMTPLIILVKFIEFLWL